MYVHESHGRMTVGWRVGVHCFADRSEQAEMSCRAGGWAGSSASRLWLIRPPAGLGCRRAPRQASPRRLVAHQGEGWECRALLVELEHGWARWEAAVVAVVAAGSRMLLFLDRRSLQAACLASARGSLLLLAFLVEGQGRCSRGASGVNRVVEPDRVALFGDRRRGSLR